MTNIPLGSCLYLDANVFIYAAEAPKTFPALMTLLKRFDDGDFTAVTSTLTLAEVLVSPFRTGNLTLQSAFRDSLKTSPTLTVAEINSPILIRAAQIRALQPAVKLADAIHIATCEANNCVAFLTNDSRIKTLDQLPVILISDLE